MPKLVEDFNARKIASSRLSRRIPYGVLLSKQQQRMADLDERIGRLMTERVNEEEILAEMIKLMPKCLDDGTTEGK